MFMSSVAVRLSRRAPAKHLPIGTPHRISQISKAYARFFGIVDKKLDAQKIQPLLLVSSKHRRVLLPLM